MDLRLLYAFILTILPFTELRVGLPVAIKFAMDKNIPIFLVFLFIVLTNILLIFFVFYFLDNLHLVLMNFKVYEKFFNLFLKKFRKKVDKFEKKYDEFGFIALMIFVAVPLPGTGAWSGSLISWILGLEKKKSILYISIGIFIAGLIILFGTLGILTLFS